MVAFVEANPKSVFVEFRLCCDLLRAGRRISLAVIAPEPAHEEVAPEVPKSSTWLPHEPICRRRSTLG
jgi:hypothetical protein